MDVLYSCVIVCLLQVEVSARCGFPGSPAHCHVSFSDETLAEGAVASYECERGFELLGPSRRLCDANGKWTPDGIPFCVINVAAGKAPMQASTAEGGAPQRALDGSTARTALHSDTCTMTKPERVPWWYVNLLEPYMVQLVRLDFGKSCCDDGKVPEVVVRVGNNRPDLGTNPVCNRFVGRVEEGQPLFLPCNPPMPGAFVSVHLEASSPQQLSICEAFVYTDQALPVERCPQFRDQPPGSTATYNGKCYIFYDTRPASFRDALAFCRSRGGTLIDESNPALQGFISWELWRRHRSDSSSRYWLGAVRDGADPLSWKWVNGNELTVSFWNAPATGHDCAHFDGSTGWLWADTDCHATLNYICQHQPKACGRPEQPPNSTLTTQRFHVGASVEYSCDEGHLLVGPTVRTCLETGFYDEFPPVCKRIECGFPAEISHGSYRLLNGSVSYLSHVQYTCQPGHEMVGRARLVCDIDERWNGPPPRCEVVQCEPLPSVSNGRVVSGGNSTSFGSVAQYSCLRGYSLHGAPALSCLATGLWDHSPPACIPEERPTTTTTTTTTTPSSVRAAPPSRRPLPTPFLPSEGTRRPRPTTERATTGTPDRPTARPTDRTTDRPTDRTTTTRQYERAPERRPTLVDRHPSTHVPHIIVANHAKENQIHSDNILEVETPGVRVPSGAEGGRRDGALPREPAPGPRLNVGAVVALAAFGVLIFLIAIITTMVILCKSRMRTGEKYQHHITGECNTEASLGSSSSESRSGLSRYYAQAWEQLHDAAGAVGGGGGERRPRLVSRDEAPRDAVELVVTEAVPRRHHHHHHHRDPRHHSERSRHLKPRF